VFPKKDHAINYAQSRASFRCGEIRILDSSGGSWELPPAARQSKAESASALNLLMKAYRFPGMVVLPCITSFYGNDGTKFPEKAERRLSLSAVVSVYDEAGNVIETHEHAGKFKEW
jgi:hypothetical protein